MRVYAVSDLHGNLPDIPECDLLVIAGDICPVDDHRLAHQQSWLSVEFADWLDRIPATNVVGIAGNHDFIFETDEYPRDLPWTYLCDEETTVGGLRIYGFPWVPNLASWAFFGGMDHVDEEKLAAIPEGIDILLSHGPMRGHGDMVANGLRVGCTAMLHEVERVKPQLFVCGHIHEGRGRYSNEHVPGGIFNVAYVDEWYQPTGTPVALPVTP